MSKKLRIAIVSLISFTVVLSACASKTAPEPAADSATAETVDEPTAEPADEATVPSNANTTKDPKDIVIGFVTPVPNDPSWQAVKDGVEQAAADCGITVLYMGPATNVDVQGTVEVMQNFIAQKVDAIAFCPFSESAFVTVAQDAKNAGIPCITYSSDLTSDTSLRLSFVGTDNKDCGTQQIEGLHKLLGTDDLKVVALMGTLDASNQMEQVEAFREYCEKLRANGADAEVLDVRDDGGATDDIKTYDTAAAMLRAHPEANVLINTHGRGAATCGKVITEMGLTGQVLVSGYDDQEHCLAALEDGSVSSLMVQNFYNWGYAPVSLLYDYLMGEELEDYYDSGVIEVTKDNIDDYKEQLITYSDAFK